MPRAAKFLTQVGSSYAIRVGSSYTIISNFDYRRLDVAVAVLMPYLEGHHLLSSDVFL